MKGPSAALLISMVNLVGCAGPVELLFATPKFVDHLDGNYKRLAACTYERLARERGQLSMTDLQDQQTVRIVLTKGPQAYVNLSFTDEDEGRQTRLEVTSSSFPSEHVLALARACAA